MSRCDPKGTQTYARVQRGTILAYMVDKTPNEPPEPASSLREIWEAVRDRAAGDPSRNVSACIAALKGRRGASWIKQRYRVFAAFRDRGVREIAASSGYSASQADRTRGLYAPSEVRRWLVTYGERVDDDKLRSLLTWHRGGWTIDSLPPAPPQPSTPHIGGLLCRFRVTDTPALLEPMGIVERYIQDLGRPIGPETATERAEWTQRFTSSDLTSPTWNFGRQSKHKGKRSKTTSVRCAVSSRHLKLTRCDLLACLAATAMGSRGWTRMVPLRFLMGFCTSPSGTHSLTRGPSFRTFSHHHRSVFAQVHKHFQTARRVGTDARRRGRRRTVHRDGVLSPA